MAAAAVDATTAAVAPAMDLQRYRALINDLMSPINDVRNGAETVLNQVQYKDLMQNILQFFESETLNNEQIHDQHKIFSSTLLKNRLPSKDSDNEIPQEMKLEFYEKYLNILQFISSIPVKNMATVFKLFDILVENIYTCLSNVSDKVQQSFFTKTIEKLGRLDNAIDPLIGIAILANTSGMWEELSISQSMLMPHVNKFFELFGHQMMELGVGCDPNLNLAANNFIKYSSAFISRSQSTQGLESIVKILFEVSFHLIVNLKLEALSGGIIDFLQEISQVRPRLFKPHLDKILDLVIYIMETYSKSNNTSLENQKIKVSAMNFLCTLFVDMSNVMMKYQEKLRVFIVHVIDCMAIPDEEDDDFDDVEDDAENQNLDHISKQSEIVFDKMSVKNPQFMFQFVTQSVTNFLKPGSSVNQMYAGLNILCCAAEGCKAQYQESLEDIVRQFVLPYTYDSQYPSKVRYAALTALGQMLSDFGNILVSRLFDDVTEAYSKALLNSSSERVQCHAFAALNNFFESASQVYIPKAVLKLSPAFASFLQQNCSQRTVMAFFDTIIPLAEYEIDSDKLYSAIHGQLFDIITNACSNKDHLPVHSKAVLAICSLGQFANQDLFKADAQKLMHGLIKMMQSDNIDLLMQNIGYDDYLLSWDILIKKFADDFKEFLEFILSKIYNILQRVHKTGMEFFQGDSFQDMNAINEAVRLQSLQSSDAIMCLRLLSTISEVYKRDVGTFMERFVDLLIIFFDDQSVMLLDHAYSALASMILTLSDEKIATTWPRLIQITLDMNSDQVDSHSFLRIMSSFMSVVTSLGMTCLSPEFLDKFVTEIILDVLETQHAESKKYAKLDYYRKNEDFEEYDMLDDGYLHEDEEEEQSYVEGIIVFVRTMFGIFGKEFQQYFERFKAKITDYLKPQNQFTANDINCALNLWVAILEQAPEDVIRHYFPSMSADIGRYMQDERYLLVHTSSYAYGLIAEKGPSDLSDAFLQQHLSIPANFLEQHAKTSAALSGDIDYHLALENIISALIRILRFKPHLTGNMKIQLTLMIMNVIPFENDIEELPNCYHFTSDLILRQIDEVKKYPLESLCKLLKVQLNAFVIAPNILNAAILEKVGQSIVKLKSDAPNFGDMIKSLSEEHQAVYHNFSMS